MKVILFNAYDVLFVRKTVVCDICGLRIFASSGLCGKCTKCIHGHCVEVKVVICMLSTDFICSKCEGTINIQWIKRKDT